MKRFYKDVSIRQDDSKYLILLDNMAVKTPQHNMMFVPTNKLAEAIATEWQAQKETLDIDSMPLTSLLYTYYDKIIPQKEQIVDALVPYLETEMVCYPSPEPLELKLEQEKIWNPIASWFSSKTNIKLNVTLDILNVAQDNNDMEQLKTILMKMPELRLTAMQAAVDILGSVVLAYAMALGQIDTNTAFEASFIEELFQSKAWGLDPDTEKKHNSIKQDLQYIYNFVELIP